MTPHNKIKKVVKPLWLELGNVLQVEAGLVLLMKKQQVRTNRINVIFSRSSQS